VAAKEVEPRLLSIESVPLGSEDEPDGLCSLSVNKEGPEDAGDPSRREFRRRPWSRQELFVCRGRSAACRDRIRVGRAGREAPTVKADAVTARPSPGGAFPGVYDPGPGATVSPALVDMGEGPWAAARAEALAALCPGTGVPSDATVNASPAASRNTWSRWRGHLVSATDRSSPWAATPPTQCRLGCAPPAADGGSSDQWSRVERCPCALARSSGVTLNAFCNSRRCRSRSFSDHASTRRLDPRPAGVPSATVPDELPTASTRGGRNGGALSERCPYRGEG